MSNSLVRVLIRRTARLLRSHGIIDWLARDPEEAAQTTSTYPECDTDAFWRFGYLRIRGVFSPEEIRRWNEAGPDREGQDLLTDPTMRELCLHERLVDLATRMPGAPPP